MNRASKEMHVIDMLALIWFGAGVFFMLIGAVEFIVKPRVVQIHIETGSGRVVAIVRSPTVGPLRVVRTEESLNPRVVSDVALGFVFTVLGLTLNVLLQRSLRRRSAPPNGDDRAAGGPGGDS